MLMIERYLPTKCEIRRRCLEIQAGWSEKEEGKRRAAAYRTVPVKFEEVVFGGCDEQESERE